MLITATAVDKILSESTILHIIQDYIVAKTPRKNKTIIINLNTNKLEDYIPQTEQEAIDYCLDRYTFNT